MDNSSVRLPASSLIALAFISIVLMVVDSRTQHLQFVRSMLSHATQPMVAAATLPGSVGRWVASQTRTDEQLSVVNDKLAEENLLLRARLQKLEALESENARLSNLMSASASAGENALLAELVEVSLEPFTHRITVNRGHNSGVYVGQAAIDTNGIMGQVTGVTPYSSVVTLITDPNHAIPVQVRRNGLRAILYGLGTKDNLSLPYLAPQSDIVEGDILVTSGMGGRFPPGYPVAQVSTVMADANEPFLEISATPNAKLDYAKQVLLIWSVADGPLAQPLPKDAQKTDEAKAEEGAEASDENPELPAPVEGGEVEATDATAPATEASQ